MRAPPTGRWPSTVRADLDELMEHLDLEEVVEGPQPLVARVRATVEATGWDLEVDRDVGEVPSPSMKESLELRNRDRQRILLG
jgi:hypothetical protein